MPTLADLSEAEQRLVVELSRRLTAELPGIGVHLTVFGSRARGDAEPDSDLDVLVELDIGRVSFADKQRLRRVAAELSIASGIIVSLLVVDRRIMSERGISRCSRPCARRASRSERLGHEAHGPAGQ